VKVLVNYFPYCFTRLNFFAENCFEDFGEIVNIFVFIQIKKGGPEAVNVLILH